MSNNQLIVIGCGVLGKLVFHQWDGNFTGIVKSHDSVEALSLEGVDYVASLTHTQTHIAALADLMKPQSKFGLIDDPGPLDIGLLKRKSISLHWEFMYTRSLFNTSDILKQHEILSDVSKMLTAGELQTTLGQHLGPVNAANLFRAHQILESGSAIGKLVLAPFDTE